MNDCINICQYISLYADGEIKIDTLKYNDILEHIKSCPECNDFFLEIESTREKLKTLKIDTPNNLHSDIMSAINDEINGHIVQIKPAHKPKYLILAGMVACLAVVIVSGNVFNNKNKEIQSRSIAPTSIADASIPKNLLNEEYALTIVANGNIDSLDIDASFIYEDNTSKYFEIENIVSNIDKTMEILTKANLNPSIIQHNNPSAQTVLMIVNS